MDLPLPPDADAVVEGFLASLPLDAVERFILRLEPDAAPDSPGRSSCSPCDAMRVLSFWFREKRTEHAISRRSRRDPAVERLAARASARARQLIIGESEGSVAPSSGGDADLSLAISLLGATADVLPPVAQRQALDTSVECLCASGDKLAAQLDASGAVQEMCGGLGDLLELDTASADDFVSVVTNLCQLWSRDAALNMTRAPAAGFAPLSHALAIGEVCRRGYFSISAKGSHGNNDATPGVTMATVAELAMGARISLGAEVIVVHVVTGMLSALLVRYGDIHEAEMRPLERAVEHALELSEAPLSKMHGRTKAVRKHLATVVRGFVSAALATVTPMWISYHLRDAGLPVPRGVPIMPLPELPRRAVALLLFVLIQDVLRLQWSFEMMADAGIGDSSAIGALDKHVASEMFVRHEYLATALGAGFCALPVDDEVDGASTGSQQSSLRSTILAELCFAAEKVYNFTLDSGMVALMQRVPAAQAILKAAYQSFACFAGVALEIPPVSEAAATNGRWGGLFTKPPPPSLVARLTGDECADLVMAATQLEVVSTAGEREDGFEAYYQGLSDVVAAVFDEADADVNAAEADAALSTARRDSPPPMMGSLPSWQRGLLNCIPDYKELLVMSGSEGAGNRPTLKEAKGNLAVIGTAPVAEWRLDPAVLTRCYLSLLLVGAPDVIPNYPWELIETRVIPTAFLLLQHQRPPLNERAHGVFGVLFENFQQQAATMFPQYIRLAVDGYPALTQPKGFEAALGILVRTLSGFGGAVDLAPLEWIAAQLRRRCDELIPVAKAADGETATMQMVSTLFGVYATLLLKVELPALPLIRSAVEGWLQTTANSGLTNQLLFTVSVDH